jgi:hypothetical protein
MSFPLFSREGIEKRYDELIPYLRTSNCLMGFPLFPNEDIEKHYDELIPYLRTTNCLRTV